MPHPRLHLLAALSMDGRLLTGAEETALVATHFAPTSSTPILSNLKIWKTVTPGSEPTTNVRYRSSLQIIKAVTTSTLPLWLLGDSPLNQKLLKHHCVEQLHLLWSSRFSSAPSAHFLCEPFIPSQKLRLSFRLREWYPTPEGAFAHYTRLR